MIVLELFSGTGRMAQAFANRGARAITVDTDYPSTFKVDVLSLSRERIIELCHGEPDVIWMGTPCQGFSVAAIGRNWDNSTGVPLPKTASALKSMELARKCAEIVSWFPNAIYGIENPRGMLRKLHILSHLPRRTITFCAFGERRMKPTDIWTNADFWITPEPCKNGMSCHDAAPRGSKTGTQGLKNAYERAAYPMEFCRSFAEAVMEHK